MQHVVQRRKRIGSGWRGVGSVGTAVGLVMGMSVEAGWVAYNDSAFKEGQVNAEFVTTYGLGRNFQGQGDAGALLRFGTGEELPVSVAFVETLSTGSVNSAGDAAEYGVGSDAEALFGGRVDLSGNMSYGDSPGWWVDMTFTGLDPAKAYTFAGTANRNGGEGYLARVTNWRILGAESYVYAASPGAHRVGEDAVEFSTGHNPNGLVARWVGIRPGEDGTVVIRTSHSVGEAAGGLPGASAFQGYSGGVFLLMEEDEHWEAYNDSAFKFSQVAVPNTTTYGLGRNFEGEGSGGLLKTFLTGETTTVSAAYEETLSTGSVNSAGDFAEFNAGSDAALLFGDKVDVSGNMSYGDSPGWAVDLVLSGLDPTRSYLVAGTANRNGGEGYLARVTNWRLVGAESATQASSQGAHRVGEDAVEFSTGHNPNGLVARWINVRPGSDGQVVLRTTHSVGEAAGGLPGASAFQGYSGGMFTVRTQPPGEYNWLAVNDSAFKEGQVNAGGVTTYGLGRNFAGAGDSGVLRDLLSGRDTPVTAAFTETLSTGSINSAGDAATFAPGSDAQRWFQGIADVSGNMSYGDSPGWALDLTFTGLDPAKAYTFVGTAHRNGGPGYAARVTNWRIVGADTFQPGSSEGAHRVGDDAVEFSTGHNDRGLVARWSDIRPGADGTVVIRTSHTVGEAAGGLPGASAFQGYAGGLFLLAEQVRSGSGGGEGIEIVGVSPASGMMDAHPQSPVRVILRTGSVGVKSDSVAFRINGTEVPFEVETVEGTTTISHQPTGLFAAGSTQKVSVSLTDDGPEPQEVSREWSFTVLDYGAADVLPASLAVDYDPAVHQVRGFAVEIGAVDPGEYPLTDLDTAAGLWDIEFTNLADPAAFNEQGYFIETQDLNYQFRGQTKGAKAGERWFPGMDPEGTSGNHFALRARTWVHLTPGYHRFNVTMREDFRLVVGSGSSAVELAKEFAPCTNCGGDDGPWILSVLVTREGLYPFELLQYNATGDASLEWVVVTPSGSRLLINETGAGGLPAYVPAGAAPTLPVLSLQLEGNQLRLEWTGGGVLQSAPAITGPWGEVVGAGSPYTTALGTADQFYRVRR